MPRFPSLSAITTAAHLDHEPYMKLVVTIPALNEEKTIHQVVSGVPRDIAGVDETEVIVVNDGSADNTAREALRAGAIVVSLPGKGGLGHVFRTGLERAMRRGADIIVNIDGDGQFNPADIRKLVQPLLQDKADFVTCSRFADPALRPTMPVVKYYGNQWVTSMINWICGGTSFTDVSCGFRAFNREAAYRLTLFGRFTYTQECFIDLFSKGLRMAEVPLKVRGVREHGKSRIASSIWKYATNSFPIILRAMRDIQPLKFFGGIAAILGGLGVICGGFVLFWYLTHTEHVNGIAIHKTTPFTSMIPIAGVLVTLSFLLGVLALLADMMGRHRRISEEMLYLARRRVYSSKRTVRVSLPPVPEESRQGLTLHDSWSFPVIREVPTGAEKVDAPVGAGGNGKSRLRDDAVNVA
ncbi:MAG TPA: glycosyltransferase family 2 protein [Tepidisphaeraceae bacterium]|jgi:glycosyltransferase involved in cell wall biosynthesis